MKIDSLSALAEIMPYYGTLDQVYRLMNKTGGKTREIWKKWDVQFGKIVTRKKIHIDNIRSFYSLLNIDEIDDIYLLSIFEVDNIRISTLDGYKIFRENIEECKKVNSIRINRLQLSLCSKDNFDMTYENVWTPLIYSSEDREFDTEYNKVLKMIEDINLNIKQIDSVLSLEEIKFRKINYIKRVIAVLKEDIDPENFKEQINYILDKNILVNKILLAYDFRNGLILKNQTFTHQSILTNLPCKTIEIVVNSQIEQNIAAFDYFKSYNWNNQVKIIHLKSTDSIWDYKKYFKKTEINNTELSFLGKNGVSIAWLNCGWNIHTKLKWSSIQWNINESYIEDVGGMIRIKNPNQMILKFSKNSGVSYSNQYFNKCKSGNVCVNYQTSVFIDLDSIQTIYKKSSVNEHHFSLKNIQYF